jgi:hypothetical protein
MYVCVYIYIYIYIYIHVCNAVVDLQEDSSQQCSKKTQFFMNTTVSTSDGTR